MEYIFGEVTRNGKVCEGLKTKGTTHSDLTGMVDVRREYTDSIIVDKFKIVEKYDSQTDEAGNCYDWYEISDHYRYIDYFTPQKESLMPYTETKQAYIGDDSVTFTNVPQGNLTVYISDNDGNYPNYSVERNSDTITVHFEPVENMTSVTISIYTVKGEEE